MAEVKMTWMIGHMIIGHLIQILLESKIELTHRA